MIQILDQTREEKIEMYMSLDKLKLAEMLVECNSHISKPAVKSYEIFPNILGDYIKNLEPVYK